MQRLTIVILILLAISCKSKKDNANTGENWVVAEKNRYVYKLNVFGNPDTTFIYTQKYKDGILTDSTTNFTVNKYSGNLVTEEVSYLIGKEKKPGEFTTTRYEYDAKGRVISRSVFGAGRLIMQQKYNYKEPNLVSNSVLIQLKSYNLSTGDTLNLSTASNTNIGYDTLTSVYEYDTLKKVVGTKFINSQGTVVSKDTNLYSGNDPLLTASLNAKGDTLKKIRYEKKDKILMAVTETDSVILFQNFFNGIQIAQKTKYKRTNEQWRSAVKFDEKGRKVEETLYKLK